MFYLKTLLCMIQQTFDFLAGELNSYILARETTLDPTTTIVVLGNVAQLTDANGGNNNKLNDKVVLSLVNVEEDRISKSPENFVRTPDNRLLYKRPKVVVNLYCLFAVNRDVTDKHALEFLSHVIRFFQFRPRFTPLDSPAMPAGIELLVLDMCSLGFEQLNHLWGVLGGKYLPSVLYKLRLVSLDEDHTEAEGELIRTIDIIGKDHSIS